MMIFFRKMDKLSPAMRLIHMLHSFKKFPSGQAYSSL